MAGLLDVLSTPESQLGLGLLAAAGSGQRFGPGLLSAVQYADAQQKEALHQKFMQAQMDNYQSEIEARKLATVKDARQQALIDRFMNGTPSEGGGAVQGGATPANLQSSGPATAQGAPATQGGVLDYARFLGIPEKAIQADMAFNDGKGIAAMLEKHGARNMQVTNGYAYDQNRVQPGYLPQLNISNDGKATQVQIGPDGQPVISAPRGAPETFGTFQGIQAGIQSANTPLKVFNPGTQREEFMRQSQVLQGQPSGAPVQPSGYAGGSRDAAAQEQIRMMQSELSRLPQGHPDRAGITREIARLQGFAPQGAGNFAAGPSADELAQNESIKAKAVDTAKADVVRDTGVRSDLKKANQLTLGIDQAIDLLKQGPTASGVGAAADKAGGFFGYASKSGDLASRLETISGWLVSNVPRMEGPQSNFDVQNYQTMAGLVGDRSKPISTRLAAAEEVKKLQEKYAHLNGRQINAGGASGSWDTPVPKVPMKGQVLGGWRFKGGDPGVQANWEQTR